MQEFAIGVKNLNHYCELLHLPFLRFIYTLVCSISFRFFLFILLYLSLSGERGMCAKRMVPAYFAVIR